MAKKSVTDRNEKRRRMALKQKGKREELRRKVKFGETPEERFAAMLAIARLPRNGSQVRVRNRCILTGRGRGYYRKFATSRIKLRDLALEGLAPGVVKSSW